MRKGPKFLILASAVLLFVSGCTISHTDVRLHRPTPIDIGLTEKLEKNQDKIDPSLRISVGGFYNKTGQFKDLSMLRYSRALTEGAYDVLYHALYIALGPRAVLERDRENIRRIEEEYEMSHLFDNKRRRVGLIQRGGPQGGTTGADFLVSGAIISYNVARKSGVLGVNIEGVGALFQKSITEVGVELKLIDMNSSQIIWNTYKYSSVSGEKIGADMFRFITSGGSQYLVSLEGGIARQMPAYFALQDCIAQGIEDMIKANDLFLAGSRARK